MKNKLSNFLLGLLWSLAIMLGGNFWFDVHYGFNIFSGMHWRYLGDSHAAGIPIKFGFYISMAVMVVLLFFGLFLILRPAIRRIRFMKRQDIELSRPDVAPEQPLIVGNQQSTIVAQNPSSTVRPPRLITGIAPPRPIPVPALTPTPTPEIESIFRDAGYIIKNPPRIDGWTPNLFAIGGDENLWIGGTDTDAAKIENAIQKLSAIFTETLEDVPITINAFVINTNSPYTTNSDVYTFSDTNALREFMTGHTAPQITSDNAENFDAYSEYVDTVAGYFNNQ